MRRNNFNWRINKQIRASEVRVIGVEGKQLGILTIEEALNNAQEAGLDLVEIAPNAKPPVVKIVELGKFRYEQEKKIRQELKKSKPPEVKEVRFSPFIADHDFENRIKKIREFLSENHKIRIVVVFTGRQMGSKKFGYDLIKKVIENFDKMIAIDMEPKFIGRHLITIISPNKKIKKVIFQENKNAETKN